MSKRELRSTSSKLEPPHQDSEFLTKLEWRKTAQEAEHKLKLLRQACDEILPQLQQKNTLIPEKIKSIESFTKQEIEGILSNPETHQIYFWDFIQIIVALRPELALDLLTTKNEQCMQRLVKNAKYFVPLLARYINTESEPLLIDFLFFAFDHLKSYEQIRVALTLENIARYRNDQALYDQVSRLNQQHLKNTIDRVTTEPSTERAVDSWSLRFNTTAAAIQFCQSIVNDVLQKKVGWEEKAQYLCGQLERLKELDFQPRSGEEPLNALHGHADFYQLETLLQVLIAKLAKTSGHQDLAERLWSLFENLHQIQIANPPYYGPKDLQYTRELREVMDNWEVTSEQVIAEANIFRQELIDQKYALEGIFEYQKPILEYRFAINILDKLTQAYFALEVIDSSHPAVDQLFKLYSDICQLLQQRTVLSYKLDNFGSGPAYAARSFFESQMKPFTALALAGDHHSRKVFQALAESEFKKQDTSSLLHDNHFATLFFQILIEAKILDDSYFKHTMLPLSKIIIENTKNPVWPRFTSFARRHFTLSEAKDVILIPASDSKTDSHFPLNLLDQQYTSHHSLDLLTLTLLPYLLDILACKQVINEAKTHRVSKKELSSHQTFFTQPQYAHYLTVMAKEHPDIVATFQYDEPLLKAWQHNAFVTSRRGRAERQLLKPNLSEAIPLLRPKNEDQASEKIKRYQTSRSLDQLIEDIQSKKALSTTEKEELASTAYVFIRNWKNVFAKKKESPEYPEVKALLRTLRALSQIDKPRAIALTRTIVSDVRIHPWHMTYLLAFLEKNSALTDWVGYSLRQNLLADRENSRKIKKLFQSLGNNVGSTLDATLRTLEKDDELDDKEVETIIDAQRQLGTVTSIIYKHFRKLEPEERAVFVEKLHELRRGLFINKSFSIVLKNFQEALQELGLSKDDHQRIIYEFLQQSYPISDSRHRHVETNKLTSPERDRPQDLEKYIFPQDGYPAEMKKTKNIEPFYARHAVLEKFIENWISAPINQSELHQQLVELQTGDMSKIEHVLVQITKNILQTQNHDFTALKIFRNDRVVNWQHLANAASEFFETWWQDNILKIVKESILSIEDKDFDQDLLVRIITDYIHKTDSPPFAVQLQELKYLHQEAKEYLEKKGESDFATSVQIFFSKSGVSFLAAASAGRCNADDLKLWENPDFWHANIVDERGILVGNIMVYKIIIEGKEALLLAGFNPLHGFLEKISIESYCETVLNIAQEFCIQNEFSGGVYISEQGKVGALSNRSNVAGTLLAKYNQPNSVTKFHHQLGFSPHFITDKIYKAR